MSYDVLKNRLTNGQPFSIETAVARINALANALEITQEQAEELIFLANANGGTQGDTVEQRLAYLEQISLEHDAALMELAGIAVGGE